MIVWGISKNLSLSIDLPEEVIESTIRDLKARYPDGRMNDNIVLLEAELETLRLGFMGSIEKSFVELMHLSKLTPKREKK